VSPTTAAHVLQSLDGKIDLVLDGGRCPGGIESTVLDLNASPPRVLRPGPIMPSELRAVIGDVTAPWVRLDDELAPLPSPGTSIRHYAPRARLECYSDPVRARARVAELTDSARRIRWFRGSAEAQRGSNQVEIVVMPAESSLYATRLYDALHDADRWGAEYIVAELPPDEEEWLAVRDRLRRAATIWSSSRRTF
jgi:L-threonylcarbamoyladenylate synthase